jgi:hypothetical protein
MAEPFVVEGDLWLCSQEGGFASDAWELDDEPLDELAAEHFGAKPKARPSSDATVTVRCADADWGALWRHVGDRHIGRVRITIEEINHG